METLALTGWTLADTYRLKSVPPHPGLLSPAAGTNGTQLSCCLHPRCIRNLRAQLQCDGTAPASRPAWECSRLTVSCSRRFASSHSCWSRDAPRPVGLSWGKGLALPRPVRCCHGICPVPFPELVGCFFCTRPQARSETSTTIIHPAPRTHAPTTHMNTVTRMNTEHALCTHTQARTMHTHTSPHAHHIEDQQPLGTHRHWAIHKTGQETKKLHPHQPRC